MAENEDRPLRGCDVCGGVDDHPRHVYAHAPGDGDTDTAVAEKMIANAPDDAKGAIIQHVRDNSTTMRHMDCCREAGCPDGSCYAVTAGAEDQRGDDLVAHLTRDLPEDGE